jgi:hypothetical protein
MRAPRPSRPRSDVEDENHHLVGGSRGRAPVTTRTVLGSADAPHSLFWHVVLTEIVAAEPERTFLCDPGHHLRALEGRNALVWVQPYPGAAFWEPQRYPTVPLLHVDHGSAC